MNHVPINPTGLCACGCGQQTKRVQSTNHGYRKGDYRKFVQGHRRTLTIDEVSDRWDLADCGYDTPCWVWNRSIDFQGYGEASYRQVKYRAHRLVYSSYVGPIPGGMELDHLCRNRACVNPDHLEPVTREVNARRGAGTRLTWSDVDEIRAADGTCQSIADRFGVTVSLVSAIRRGERWKPETREMVA